MHVTAGDIHFDLSPQAIFENADMNFLLQIRYPFPRTSLAKVRYLAVSLANRSQQNEDPGQGDDGRKTAQHILSAMKAIASIVAFWRDVIRLAAAETIIGRCQEPWVMSSKTRSIASPTDLIWRRISGLSRGSAAKGMNKSRMAICLAILSSVA
jgi:hypothetical protein